VRKVDSGPDGYRRREERPFAIRLGAMLVVDGYHHDGGDWPEPRKIKVKAACAGFLGSERCDSDSESFPTTYVTSRDVRASPDSSAFDEEAGWQIFDTKQGENASLPRSWKLRRYGMSRGAAVGPGGQLQLTVTPARGRRRAKERFAMAAEKKGGSKSGSCVQQERIGRQNPTTATACRSSSRAATSWPT
jgi:hypothetical protein